MTSVQSRKGLPPRSGVVPGLERIHFAALHEIQEIIDGLVEQIALVSCDGTIIAVNESWRRQVERQARSGLHISRDYLSFLSGLIEGGDDGVRPILQAFRDISAGSRRTFRCLYKGSGAFDGHDFNIIVAALTVQETPYNMVSVHDVTELVALKRERRRIGSQLLRAQESERRRIARELHDSTSQMLVALQMDLSRLAASVGSEHEAIIADCRKSVQEIQQEIRALSFLAHPPFLVRHDLEVALKNLARGFAARTGLMITVDVSDGDAVSGSVEAAIYRISQEAFANIYRHAGAECVTVRVVGRKNYVHLMIRDDGIGFDAIDTDGANPLGVGLSGMKERVRDLGGRLSIKRADTGTALTVSLPRDKRMIFAPPIGGR